MRTLLPVLALGAAGAHAGAIDPQGLPPTTVQDLHYGDVLFHYFQQDDFEALTRIGAYRHWNQLSHHDLESQLLEGGLYLSLGMYNEAGNRFERLLKPDVPQGVRDRAWFYLGQMWYTRGYLDRAEAALRRPGKLTPQQEGQRVHLIANLMLRQGRYEEAIPLLQRWTGLPVWMAYAKLNLGIALARAGRLPEADTALTAVGALETADPELLALRDRANVALGFAWLQAKQPQQALAPLQRVRLNGPYSTRALLGLGWAETSLGNFQAAITPWKELRGRSLLDSAVQESYLALPYAYAKLGAAGEAAAGYEQALQSFADEHARLDGAIGRVRSGTLLTALLAGDRSAAQGWFWQLQNVPDAPESRYLYTILADDDFQEGLKNYRDLRFLGGTLDNWRDSTSAFADMIDAREKAYALRLPATDALLASGSADRLHHERDGLAARLDRIENGHDVAALGTPAEREHWAKLQDIESALAAAPDDADNRALRDRLRLVKGVLYFQLDDAFRARVWQQRRTIKDLDAALHEAQSRWVRVERARRNVPTNTAEFAARINALKVRLGALQVRLADVERRQDAYLSQLAVAALAGQQDRLDTYQVQARFALATLYDRAANPDTRPGPGAPDGAAGNQEP